MPRQAEEIGKLLPIDVDDVDTLPGIVWNILSGGNPNRNAVVLDCQGGVCGCKSLGHPNPGGTANGVRVRSRLAATKSRLTPERDCEYDVRGRFTKSPFGKSQGRFHPSSVFSSVSAFLAGPVTPARKSHGRTGATPCFECPVRAWAGVGFHKRHPALSGGRSRLNPSLAGRRRRSHR